MSWDDAEPGRAAGPTRVGNRGIGLRGSGQLDRSRRLFARADGSATAVPPTLATLFWALAMGAVGALLGWLIRSVGLWVRPIVHLNADVVTSALGLIIGLTAMTYQLITGHSFTQVLFSGQDALRAGREGR